MRRVHYLEDSRAHRVLWLLEELGLDYEIRMYRRGPDMRAPAALKEIHPLGKSPVLEDDGRVIAESGAITEYLATRYGAGGGLLPPAGSEAALRCSYWLHYAEGSVMPLLVQKLLFSKLPGRVPALIRPAARMISAKALATLVDPQLRDHTAYWDAELARDGWFAGPSFTAADIMMSFPAEAAADRAMDAGVPPAIARYLAAIRSRPAYQRALARGAYRYADTGR